MKVYASAVHERHAPPFEVVDGGQRTPYLESPARVKTILAALREQSWADIVEPAGFGLTPVREIHSAEYLRFLSTAWDQWLTLYPENQRAPEDAAFLPATFALRRTGAPLPTSLLGRAGYHMMDLSAVITEGTFDAALAAVNCALSAAHAVSNDENPQSSAFAVCRPPGHHAGPDYAAGYCFLNNAAIAAHWLSAKGKVAILDVDYHACNGTQDVFYSRSDVLTISLHADPAAEYPYYAGYADETGTGDGLGFHRNFPLPAGIDDDGYLRTLGVALARIASFAPRYLVVSTGMDIYEEDPLGRFKITTEGIRRIGARIADLAVPTAILLEGGYNTAKLGTNVVAFLSAFASRD